MIYPSINDSGGKKTCSRFHESIIKIIKILANQSSLLITIFRLSILLLNYLLVLVCSFFSCKRALFRMRLSTIATCLFSIAAGIASAQQQVQSSTSTSAVISQYGNTFKNAGGSILHDTVNGNFR